MLFRTNIRRSKSFIWLLNIAAILCISLVFAMIYKKKNDGDFKPMSGDLLLKALQKGMNNPTTEFGNTLININNYSPIWKANISGEKIVPEDLVTEAPPDLPAAGTIKEIVAVMWICDSPDPEKRWVRLSYLKEQEEPAFVLEILNREGDSLRYPYNEAPYFGKIVKIEADKVVFSYKGVEDSLTPLFAGEEEGARNRGGPRDRFPSGIVRPKTPPPEESKEIEPGHWLLSKDESKYLGNSWEKELDLLTIASRKDPKTGKTQLEITDLKAGSLAARRGFIKGDALISINGFPIHTKAGAINYVKDNPDLSEYVVVISRQGQLITKTFTAPNE